MSQLRPGRKDGILPLKQKIICAAYLGPRDWQQLALVPVPDSVSVTSHRTSLTMATLIQNIFLVFPSLSNAETAHRPTTRISEDPIYFYDSDKPYFELAKLS